MMSAITMANKSGSSGSEPSTLSVGSDMIVELLGVSSMCVSGDMIGIERSAIERA